MASPFKIPKKKQAAGSDPAHLHVQSPLSRLQSPAPEFKSYGGQPSRGGADRVHAGSRQSAPHNFRDVVRTLLGLGRGAPANHRAAGGGAHQSQPGWSAEASSDGWRHKRAAERRLQPPSPPQKKTSDLRASSPPARSVSVEAPDSLAQLRGEEHAGSLSPGRVAEGKQKKNSPGRRRSLDPKEERRKSSGSTVLRLRLKPRHTEPIVLSSEEEDEEEEEGEDGGRRTLQGSSRLQARSSGGGAVEAPPSFLQLDFSSLHVGRTHADASGKVTISESGIIIPLTGVEEGSVAVVATQVRGYGVWDGGVARGGALLAGWKGPAPSLIFLWVSDAQANLLQVELSAIHTSTCASGPSCSFLLLVLKEQLQELQAALLASILDMKEYKQGCSSGGPSSPLDWTDGLLLLHSCPPPLDQHLLGLLGHSAEKSSPARKTQSSLNSSGLQQLPTRLIQYPAAPSKGRITVTKEDLACLRGGEFLNDVIIDFYLKYLLLEGVGGPVAQRSHVFSSFFYKQLSRRRAAGEGAAPSVPDRRMRHQRVKTWTRHVDIFTKDFLFVPVNQEAHWFLVVVCFPGLEELRYEEVPAGGSERAAGKPQQPPECTQQGWQRDAALQRPCILVMDSLKLSYHENVCRLLRDYLQVEWEVRRGTPRLFTSDTMRSSSCRVPQQDNSSDCGLYLLQYAESFLQNPVVHFELPLRLDSWFPRQRVRQKREEIRSLIMRMHQNQNQQD